MRPGHPLQARVSDFFPTGLIHTSHLCIAFCFHCNAPALAPTIHYKEPSQNTSSLIRSGRAQPASREGAFPQSNGKIHERDLS